MLIMIAALVFGAAVANAQPGGWGGQRPDPAEMAQRMADRMKEQLQLNEDQYAKILDMYKKENEEREKMFAEGGFNNGGDMDFEAMRKVMEERRAKRDEQLKTILTEDQFKKYQENMANMRRNFGGGGGPGGPGM